MLPTYPSSERGALRRNEFRFGVLPTVNESWYILSNPGTSWFRQYLRGRHVRLSIAFGVRQLRSDASVKNVASKPTWCQGGGIFACSPSWRQTGTVRRGKKRGHFIFKRQSPSLTSRCRIFKSFSSLCFKARGTNEVQKKGKKLKTEPAISKRFLNGMPIQSTVIYSK